MPDFIARMMADYFFDAFSYLFYEYEPAEKVKYIEHFI